MVSTEIRPMILLVDDNEKVMMVMARIVHEHLRRAGVVEQVDVCKADTFGEAIGHAETLQSALGLRGRYLLVSDGNLPGGTGDRVVVKLRQIFGDKLLLAAIVSGSPDEFAPICRELNIPLIDKTLLHLELGPLVLEFLKRLKP